MIMGSTGSIGTQTLAVCRQDPEELMVTGLAAGGNLPLLEEQIREFHPVLACISDREDAAELCRRLLESGFAARFNGENDTSIAASGTVTILWGMDGLLAMAAYPAYDIFVGAIVGMIGIRPTIAAIRAGKDIALANKETLVCAGQIILPLVKSCGVHLYPVDSEHSAIFQCLQGAVLPDGTRNPVDHILLTASGGPFRNKTKEELATVQLEDALKHPNWSMGRKITVDSSTLVNKGLEVMEAHWLFDVPYDRISVVIQPESVIHSMVLFEDGAVIAQLGAADMRIPIQYALLYPKRKNLGAKRLDFASLKEIHFDLPDPERFPALELAYEAGKAGGAMPTIYNAANEFAVSRFLHRQADWSSIAESIALAMKHIPNTEAATVDEILRIQQQTYDYLRAAR